MKGSLTTGRETLAYAAAQIVKTAAVYHLGPFVNGPLIWFLGGRLEGFGPVLLVTLGLSLFWAVAVLILFLPFRSLLGAAPERVVGSGRGQAIATSWGEAAAFFLAAVVQSLLGWASNFLLGEFLFRPLFEAGQGDLIPLVSFGTLAVTIAICFVIFIGLRRMLCRAS